METERGAMIHRSTASGRRGGTPLAPGVAWLLVPIAALVTHASYVANGFTWLDHLDIERQAAIVPLSDWPTAFVTRFGDTGFYRPLVTLAHSLDRALYGDWAVGFHATNVLLHAAVAAASVPFVRCLFALGPLEAAVAGLVMAVHPLSSLPAGAISYRPELLLSLFTLLAIRFHASARRSGRWTTASAAAGATLLALLSKETALLYIPALVLLWELASRSSAPRGVSPGPGVSPKIRSSWNVPEVQTPRQRSAGLFAAEAVAVAVWLALRLHAVPELWHATSTPLPWSQALGTRLAVLGTRLLELVLPLKPHLSDAVRVVGVGSLPALLTAGVALGVLLLVLRRGFRSPWSAAVLFTSVALAPALNLVPLPRFSSPHYGYLASLGAGTLAVLGLRAAAGSPKLEGMLRAGLGVWLAAAAFSTFAAGARYHDDVSLFGPEVARDPWFLEGRSQLGDALVAAHRDELAAQHYEVALKGSEGILAYVDRRSVAINLAGVRLRQQRFAEAEALLAAAARDAPPRLRGPIAYDRALVAWKLGDPERVVALLDAAGADWQDPEPLLLRVQALRRLGRTDDAVETLRRVLPLVDEPRREELERVLLMLAREGH
jgi:tetratricopeptide (TPR) repeat protein